MPTKNTVVHSFSLDGELRCVDVFQRVDGTYGFEEYRREAEDPRGWFAIGGFSRRQYESAGAALAAAKTHVHWLAEIAPE